MKTYFYNILQTQIESWWATLPVSEKEVISGLPYPQCTDWWETHNFEQKEFILGQAKTKLAIKQGRLEKWAFSY
ncbi:MAG: hypothetical protein MJZ73_05775 [Bacteroidaceae bacterium]|nr:hypothetical protein [Bacteroidaceae bacterium]